MAPAGPLTAVGRALRRSLVLSGRARRAEYWWFQLFCALVLGAAYVASLQGDRAGTAGAVVYALTVPAQVTVTVRRLHDIGRSGWSVLIALVPLLGGLVLLAWTLDATTADNRWGPARPGRHADLGGQVTGTSA